MAQFIFMDFLMEVLSPPVNFYLHFHYHIDEILSVLSCLTAVQVAEHMAELLKQWLFHYPKIQLYAFSEFCLYMWYLRYYICSIYLVLGMSYHLRDGG